MVWLFVALCIFLFFPLFVNCYLFYRTGNRLVFSINLYCLKIFGGYIRYDKGTVFIHYGSNKAKAIKLVDAKGMKVKIKGIKLLTVTRFKAAICLKGGGIAIASHILASVLKRAFLPVLSAYMPQSVVDIRIENSTKNELFLKTTVAFNIFVILLILLKTIGSALCKTPSRKKT